MRSKNIAAMDEQPKEYASLVIENKNCNLIKYEYIATDEKHSFLIICIK